MRYIIAMVFILAASTNASSASLVTGFGQFQMGDADNLKYAKEVALAEARTDALTRASSFVRSDKRWDGREMTESVDVMSVAVTKSLGEKSRIESRDGAITVFAEVELEVDTVLLDKVLADILAVPKMRETLKKNQVELAKYRQLLDLYKIAPSKNQLQESTAEIAKSNRDYKVLEKEIRNYMTRRYIVKDSAYNAIKQFFDNLHASIVAGGELNTLPFQTRLSGANHTLKSYLQITPYTIIPGVTYSFNAHRFSELDIQKIRKLSITANNTAIAKVVAVGALKDCDVGHVPSTEANEDILVCVRYDIPTRSNKITITYGQ